MNKPKIIMPGDKEFNAPGSPLEHAIPISKPTTNALKISREMDTAAAILLRTMAGKYPELIAHLTTGGTIRITTNSKAIIELPFIGIAGRA